jgi:hypothetical protein
MARRLTATLSLALGVLLATTSAVHADVFVIDSAAAGSLFDGLIDGFPLPPPGTPPDGIADFAGNPLAVALQSGVTEERGIAELPLASLAGLGSADIASATLVLNIDDVISTFGPGTTFDGTAAESIVVFSYSGNGAIDLADFENVAGTPAGVVDTTPHGVITDATLATTGPLVFEVDVTDRLGALLDASATHMGFVFATTDDGTATSIDDLGLNSAGPPGVRGAALPYLIVTTAASEPPLFGKPELKCQQTIGKEAGTFANTKQKEITKCLDQILKAVSKGENPAVKVAAKCAKGIDEANPASKLAKTRATSIQKIVDKCAGLVPADVGSPCDGGAATFGDVATCVIDRHQILVEQMVRASYAGACDMLVAIGLDGGFPAICTAP